MAWILKLPKDYEAYPLILYVIVGTASVPLWYKLGIKFGSLKIFILGCLIRNLATIPLLFLSDLVTTIIVYGIGGLGMDGFWTLSYVLMGDIIDELTLKAGKRREGTYNGIEVFIARLAIAFQVLLFAVVHTATNYIAGDPGVVIQSSEALFGIRVIIALIPMIVMVIGTIIFWKVYDITPKKAASLKDKLKELKI